MENSLPSPSPLSASTAGAPGISNSGVRAAIQGASARTGVSFDFLLETAKRESSLNPHAHAKTSSAAGLFQFIEQTWLGVVHEFGDKHGLSTEASAIKRGADGKFTVADKNMRERILDLRYSAEKAAALAAELTAHQHDLLEAKLGKNVGSGALYAAHFLGLGGAVKLLSSNEKHTAASLFPDAAAANKAVFYEGARAKTVAEVLSSFEASFSAQPSNRPEGLTFQEPSRLPVARTAEIHSTPVLTKTVQPPNESTHRADGFVSTQSHAIEGGQSVERERAVSLSRISKLSVPKAPINSLPDTNFAQHLSPTVMQILFSLNPGTILRSQK